MFANCVVKPFFSNLVRNGILVGECSTVSDRVRHMRYKYRISANGGKASVWEDLGALTEINNYRTIDFPGNTMEGGHQS